MICDAAPLRLAEHYANARRSHFGHLTMLRYAGEWWACDGKRCGHRGVSDERVAAEVLRHLDAQWRPEVDAKGKPTGGVVRFSPKVRQAADAVTALKAAVPAIETDDPVPGWTCPNPPAAVDSRSAVTFANGVLNLDAYLSGDDGMIPPDPRWFCPAALPYDFDPDAAEPRAWLDFLDSLDMRADERDLLQTFAGYLLTADTSQQKALMLVGPRRSGKGTIMRVLTELVGRANTASPTLAGLATNFGLQALIGKRLATVTDARLSGRTDQAVVVERLLSITGEDAQTVDRKHRDPVTLKLDARFVIATNELPRLSDSSGALSGRFLILPLRRSFYGREDHGLTARLMAELPGIVAWALEGLATLRENGRFEQPDSGAEMQAEMDDLASPVGAFVRECCEVGPALDEEREVMFAAWRRWCEENGRHAGASSTFGRDLKAAEPAVQTARPREGGGRIRKYVGIALLPGVAR